MPARRRRRPAAAIIAALSVDNIRLGTKVGTSRAAPRDSRSARSRLLAETPPAMPTLFASYRRAAAYSRSISAVTTTRWKLAATSAVLRHVRAHDRRLQPAEAEVEIPLQLRRVPIRVRQARCRQRNRAVVAGRCEAIDDRPARVAQA